MALIDDCLAGAVKIGTLSAKGAAEYTARMKDAAALAEQRGLAGPDGYSFTISEAAKEMEKRATNKRAQVQQQILAIDRAWDGAKSNTKGTGFGLTQTFGSHVAGETPKGGSIVQQHHGNLKTMQSIMADFMAEVQSKMLGMKNNRVLPVHTVSSLFGRDVGDPAAKAAAQAWDQSMAWWRSGMDRAGVFVRNLADWRLPQHFDVAEVRHMGEGGFISQMEQWWKQGKLGLRDWEADGDAYLVPGRADARAREIFKTAYDNISSGGDAAIEPGVVKGSSLSDRYGRRRAFEWMSDEAWLEFNNKMGVGDAGIGELMIRHIDNISRDLGVAQVLGPDPDRAARTLIQMYQKEGGSKFWANKLASIYEGTSGKAQAPVSQRLALIGQTIRQGLSAVQLGGAVLSAPSDFAFTGATAAWHGLDMSKIMVDYVARLKPQSMADRAEALRSVTILEVGMRGLGDIARDVIGDVVGRTTAGGRADGVLNGLSAASGRMAEVVIRGQGLAHHTQALRGAIGSQLQAHFSDIAPKAWGELASIDRRTLETYGMGQKDWDILRKQGVQGGFMDPTRLAREGEGVNRDAAVKMLGAIDAISRVAVPEGNAVTRALVMGGTRPGTIDGEILRSIAQYKGFPMGSFMMHYFKSIEPLRDGEGAWSRGTYISSLIVGATVLGAVSLQLKNIAYGKDPEPMFNQHAAKFWSLAFAQGGAGGIFGDQLKALAMASQQGDASRMLSPTGGLIMDTLGLTRGNVSQTLAGQKAHAGRDLVNYANKYTPDIWYTKLAMDRLVWDTLMKMADPEAAGTFARIQERARKEQETSFYWRPGSANIWQGRTGLNRGPDLSNAAKGLVTQ